MRCVLVACLCLLCFPTVCSADETFDRMDPEHRGCATWEAFHDAYPDLKRPAFDLIDRNRDGVIGTDEWDMFRAHHDQSKKAGMPPAMPPSMPIIPLRREGESRTQSDRLPLIRPPRS